MPRRILHQFPISHYCEKTRWHLDWKGLSYTKRDLVPGAHVLIHRRIGARRTVPVLVDDGRVVSDSTDIAVYLDAEYKERALIPKEGELRARCRELEEYFDEALGPAVRRFAYGLSLEEPGRVPKMFFAGYGPVLSRLGPPLLGRLLERVLRRSYRITPESVKRSEAKIYEALERLETEIGGDPSRYLVGNELTLADVTAASLLGPLVAAPESPWAGISGDERMQALRSALRARPAGRWVLERYAKDRPRPVS